MYTDKRADFFKDRYENRARLIIKCPDQPGIVSAISTFLWNEQANIVSSNQFTVNPKGGEFFMRLDFEYQPGTDVEKLKKEFREVAGRFQMEWRLSLIHELKNMAIFVSKEPHCLLELLWEWQSGDLMANIPVVISNHENAREMVEALGIDFYHLPITKETKQEIEAKQKEILEDYDIDLIILARYMQILSPAFVEVFKNRIINIHHSFLPAFIGAKPYERAFERGVKMIGATSHYVTNDLDEGPIIEQGTEPVSHEHNVDDFKNSKTILFIYRIAALVMVVFGTLASFGLVWSLADVTMALLALINLFAISVLFKKANILLKDYMKQRKEGKDPVFYKDTLDDQTGIECWERETEKN